MYTIRCLPPDVSAGPLIGFGRVAVPCPTACKTESGICVTALTTPAGARLTAAPAVFLAASKGVDEHHGDDDCHHGNGDAGDEQDSAAPFSTLPPLAKLGGASPSIRSLPAAAPRALRHRHASFDLGPVWF